MKKGIAVPYVIALILGIIILAIAAYLIYKAIMGDQLNCQECKATFTTWCSTCYLSNPQWSGNYQLGKDLATCLDKCNYWPGVTLDTTCTNTNAPTQCKGIGIG